MLFTAIVRILSLQVFLLVGLSQSIPQSGSSQPKLQLAGNGRQLYSCVGGTWTSTGADAQLSGGRGTTGHHYFEGGRPVFNLGNGQPPIYATKTGSQPAPGQGNIPWLRLTPSSGPYSLITRTNTQGGVPPPGSCRPGSSTSVPYSATYSFY